MPTNVVLCDGRELIARTPLLGVYYGKKSRGPDEIARYRRVYENLDQHARPVEALMSRAGGAAALPRVS